MRVSTEKDITVLYYTANLIEETFANAVRRNLAENCACPIVSVSQKPIQFGTNVCVGEIGASIFNVYKQILDGAMRVQTKYVACCEDDTLYHPEHFTHRPTFKDAFAYNYNAWTLDFSGVYYYRARTHMSMCIAETAHLIDVLRRRFGACLTPDARIAKYFSEPGKYDGQFGIFDAFLEVFVTKAPCVIFNHKPSLGGLRKLRDTDIFVEKLPYWGCAMTMWSAFSNGGAVKVS